MEERAEREAGAYLRRVEHADVCDLHCAEPICGRIGGLTTTDEEPYVVRQLGGGAVEALEDRALDSYPHGGDVGQQIAEREREGGAPVVPRLEVDESEVVEDEDPPPRPVVGRLDVDARLGWRARGPEESAAGHEQLRGGDHRQAVTVRAVGGYIAQLERQRVEEVHAVAARLDDGQPLDHAVDGRDE